MIRISCLGFSNTSTKLFQKEEKRKEVIFEIYSSLTVNLLYMFLDGIVCNAGFASTFVLLFCVCACTSVCAYGFLVNLLLDNTSILADGMILPSVCF